jgi:hypothetical protein
MPNRLLCVVVEERGQCKLPLAEAVEYARLRTARPKQAKEAISLFNASIRLLTSPRFLFSYSTLCIVTLSKNTPFRLGGPCG